MKTGYAQCLKNYVHYSGQKTWDEIYYVYVVDDDERLRGVFPLKDDYQSFCFQSEACDEEGPDLSTYVDTPMTK